MQPEHANPDMFIVYQKRAVWTVCMDARKWGYHTQPSVETSLG